jgi:hypothetical protein
MAASPHYRYKTGTLEWTPDGGSAIPILGLQTLRFSEGGEVTDLMSDASELVQEQPLHSIKGAIEIGTLNQAHMALDLGAGSLTFDIERVKSGRGAVSSSAKTVTFGNAVLKSKVAPADSTPGGTTTLSFEAADDSGDIFTIVDA